MFSRAVTFGTNRSDQQKWSAVYSYTLTVVLLVVLVMTVSSLWAQTSITGAIAGVVTDPTAAVLPGVSVMLKNIDTGSSASTTSVSFASEAPTLKADSKCLTAVSK